MCSLFAGHTPRAWLKVQGLQGTLCLAGCGPTGLDAEGAVTGAVLQLRESDRSEAASLISSDTSRFWPLLKIACIVKCRKAIG